MSFGMLYSYKYDTPSAASSALQIPEKTLVDDIYGPQLPRDPVTGKPIDTGLKSRLDSLFSGWSWRDIIVGPGYNPADTTKETAKAGGVTGDLARAAAVVKRNWIIPALAVAVIVILWQRQK